MCSIAPPGHRRGTATLFKILQTLHKIQAGHPDQKSQLHGICEIHSFASRSDHISHVKEYEK